MITTLPSDVFPVYVDESYGPDHPALCVAGYIFSPNKAKEMSSKWALLLASKALPYFHMNECNRGRGVFSHLDDDECDAVARQVIALTRDYAEFGFGISMNPADYDELMPADIRAEAGSAYSFCLRHCLTMTRRWAERTGFGGKFAFFFENGHEHAKEAREIIADYQRVADRFRYYSSEFIEKEDAEPLQAADILAWHFYVNYRRVAEQKPSRLDFVALLREHDSTLELSRERLLEMIPKLERRWRERLQESTSYASGEGASGAMPGR